MTKLQKGLIGAGVVVILAVIVIVSIASTDDDEDGTEVYISEAVRQDLVSTVSATGRIEPRTKVEVSSSVMGEIVQMPVDEGDRVRRGDLLVQIDPELYRSEVQRLEASLRMARIEIQRQEASVANARATLRRQERLAEQGITPPDVLEKAQLEVRTGEIVLDSLREQVSQATSSLQKARDELRKTRIVSPIAGVVTQRNAELGEMTVVGTMNNPGTVIMTVSDLSEILAEVDVDETRVVQIEPDQRARVVVDAVGELAPYDGRVVEIAGTAVQRQGEAVRVFPVKIELDDPDTKLRPGMTAKARIETQRAEGAITVPIQAVVIKPRAEVDKILAARGEGSKKKAKAAPIVEPASAGSAATKAPAPAPPQAKGVSERAGDTIEVVYRVVDGKAVLTRVRTGLSDETSVVIVEGVGPGDSVVSGPSRAMKKLDDGDAVKKKVPEDTEEGEDDGEDGETGDGEDEESGVQVEVD